MRKITPGPAKTPFKGKANLRWLAWQCIEFSPVETTRHQRVKREKAQTSKFRGLYRPPGACCVLDLLLPTNNSCNVTAPIARLPCVCCRCQRIAHPSPFFSALAIYSAHNNHLSIGALAGSGGQQRDWRVENRWGSERHRLFGPRLFPLLGLSGWQGAHGG